MKVLLSIKPEFVEKIFEGNKRFEYRRTIFKRNDIEKVIIYASSPISKVVGEFDVEQVIFDSIEGLWCRTEKYSGISKEYYMNYFSNKEKGYAIKIKSCLKYDNPFNIKAAYGVTPPQSFLYLE